MRATGVLNAGTDNARTSTGLDFRMTQSESIKTGLDSKFRLDYYKTETVIVPYKFETIFIFEEKNCDFNYFIIWTTIFSDIYFYLWEEIAKF